MSWLKLSIRKEEQLDWAVAFYWSSQPIIPTPRLAASDFPHCFDDNVLRQAAKVMTISRCGTVQGCAALRSNVLALHSATFNTDTWSEIDTKVCREPTEEYRSASGSDECNFNCLNNVGTNYEMIIMKNKRCLLTSPSSQKSGVCWKEKKKESVNF